MENFTFKLFTMIIISSGLLALLGAVLDLNEKIIKVLCTITVIAAIILINILIINA